MPLHVDGLEDAWGCFYQKCMWTSDKTREDVQALLCLSLDSVLLTALVFFSNGGVAVRDLGAGADQLEELADPGPSTAGPAHTLAGVGEVAAAAPVGCCVHLLVLTAAGKWLAGEASPACLGKEQ